MTRHRIPVAEKGRGTRRWVNPRPRTVKFVGSRLYELDGQTFMRDTGGDFWLQPSAAESALGPDHRVRDPRVLKKLRRLHDQKGYYKRRSISGVPKWRRRFLSKMNTIMHAKAKDQVKSEPTAKRTIRKPSVNQGSLMAALGNLFKRGKAADRFA